MQNNIKNSSSLFKRFGLLLTFTIFLIFADTHFSIVQNIRLVFSIITNPIYSIVNIPNSIGKFVNNTFVNKQQLQLENQNLVIENNFLKAKFQKYNSLLYKLQQLQDILNIHNKNESVNFKVATVIKINQSRIRKQIIIDKGKTDNVFFGEIVIGSKGVIGYIKNIDILKSKVLLISDPTHQITVKNQRNGLNGILSGKVGFKHLLKFDFMPNNADIVIGDIFVTHNINKKVLNNFLVAKVTKINNNSSQYFMDVELEPIEKLGHLDTVLLLDNNHE